MASHSNHSVELFPSRVCPWRGPVLPAHRSSTVRVRGRARALRDPRRCLDRAGSLRRRYAISQLPARGRPSWSGSLRVWPRLHPAAPIFPMPGPAPLWTYEKTAPSSVERRLDTAQHKFSPNCPEIDGDQLLPVDGPEPVPGVGFLQRNRALPHHERQFAHASGQSFEKAWLRATTSFFLPFPLVDLATKHPLAAGRHF